MQILSDFFVREENMMLVMNPGFLFLWPKVN